ncbi:MAG TPA: TlpA disulfide reductase family protein [Anaerolineae bacterium]|jgi:cytochrome c biogenesis protein CcmG/thiol:disulfide interchange protein DsbE
MIDTEQTIPRPKPSAIGRNIVIIGGTLFLVIIVTVMAINLNRVESVQLQGNPAPDFTLPLFDQFEQDQLTLSELRGQVVVINFWASWCVECYKEAALLEQAWQEHQDQGVMFIGVDYLDTDKEALAYLAQYGITYPSGPDIGDEISKAFAITGVPETFFIDKDGNIAHVQIGPIEKAQLYALLDRLIKQPRQDI